MPYCAYCGHEVSAQAVTCPNCGHPQGAVPGAAPAAAMAGTQDAPVVLEYAGFWIRFLSLFIDGLILFVVQIPLFAISVASTLALHGRGFFFFNPLGYAISFLYEWLMIGNLRGQTLGMMATRPD